MLPIACCLPLARRCSCVSENLPFSFILLASFWPRGNRCSVVGGARARCFPRRSSGMNPSLPKWFPYDIATAISHLSISCLVSCTVCIVFVYFCTPARLARLARQVCLVDQRRCLCVLHQSPPLFFFLDTANSIMTVHLSHTNFQHLARQSQLSFSCGKRASRAVTVPTEIAEILERKAE